MKEEKIKTLIEELQKLAPNFRRNVIQPPTHFKKKLSPHQHLCLYIIYNSKSITMTDLALKLGVSNQQLTRIMDFLVKKNLVERYPSPDNRRTVISEITKDGKLLLQSIRKEMQEYFIQSLSNLTEDEVDELLAHFQAINNILTKSMKKNNSD